MPAPRGGTASTVKFWLESLAALIALVTAGAAGVAWLRDQVDSYGEALGAYALSVGVHVAAAIAGGIVLLLWFRSLSPGSKGWAAGVPSGWVALVVAGGLAGLALGVASVDPDHLLSGQGPIVERWNEEYYEPSINWALGGWIVPLLLAASLGWAFVVAQTTRGAETELSNPNVPGPNTRGDAGVEMGRVPERSGPSASRGSGPDVEPGPTPPAFRIAPIFERPVGDLSAGREPRRYEIYSCPHCGKRLATSNGLEQHLAAKHSG